MALPHLTFIVQATVCRALFTAAILASRHHDPVVSFRTYPPAVQERMRARPEYAQQIPTDAKTVGRKIAAAFVIATAHWPPRPGSPARATPPVPSPGRSASGPP